jgi:hypothetical protein
MPRSSAPFSEQKSFREFIIDIVDEKNQKNEKLSDSPELRGKLLTY